MLAWLPSSRCTSPLFRVWLHHNAENNENTDKLLAVRQHTAWPAVTEQNLSCLGQSRWWTGTLLRSGCLLPSTVDCATLTCATIKLRSLTLWAEVVWTLHEVLPFL